MSARLPLLPIALILGALLLAALTIWQSLGWVEGAQLFPYYLGLATVAIGLAALAEHLLASRRPGGGNDTVNTADLTDEEAERTPEFRRAGLVLFAWLVGLCLLAALIGMLAAAPVWTLLLLRLRYRAPGLVAASLAVGLVVLMLLLENALMMRLPASLLFG